MNYYCFNELSSNHFVFCDLIVRRRSKVPVLLEALRRNMVKGLDKMVTDPTPMSTGIRRQRIGMILCLNSKDERHEQTRTGELEVHLRRCSTLTTTMILDIQRAVVEAATESQVIVDKRIADKVENL